MDKNATKNNTAYLLFMLVLSIFAILLLSFDTIFLIDQHTHRIIEYADTLLCILFFLDFLVTFYTSDRKLNYLITWGWLDFVSSIPMVSSLRWGRSARIVRIFRVLRGIRSARIVTSYILERRAQSVTLAAVLTAIILITISSISILYFEKVPGANIKTAEDALWWSFVTITTVGYGDKYPITTEGRGLAVVLMIAGMGLFSTLSGFIAAWFLSPGQSSADSDLKRLENQIDDLCKYLEDKERNKN
jgi:voltage-gated potassium channel